MGDGRSQVISFRLTDEMYGKLKAYAEGQGESVNEAARKAVENFLSLGQVPPPEIPGDQAELPGRVARLEEGMVQLRGYMKGFSQRVDTVQEMLDKLLGIVGAPMPQWPALSAAGRGMKAKRRQKPS
jgi:hypothetical protein